MDENPKVKKINETITRIGSIINRNLVGGLNIANGLYYASDEDQTINGLYAEMETLQREIYGDSSIAKRIKKSVNNKILIIKKEIVSYYNQKVYIVQSCMDTITGKLPEVSNTDDRAKIEEELRKIGRLPFLTNIITNAQDKLSLDFNKLHNDLVTIATLLFMVDQIDNVQDVGRVFDFVVRHEIPTLEDQINKYNENVKWITKTSIVIDAQIIKLKLRKIESECATNNRISISIRERINYVDSLMDRIKPHTKDSVKNKDYQALKEKIFVFMQELTVNSVNVNDDNYWLSIEERYKKLSKEIDDKFQNSNKQLYSYLKTYLKRLSDLIDKGENNGRNKSDGTSTKDDSTKDDNQKDGKEEETYHIEKVEDAKGFYQKFEKQILLASGIACMALLNSFIAPVIIPAIIFANFAAANKFAIIKSISDLLVKAIKGRKGENGIITKANGVVVDAKEAVNSLTKSVATIGKKSKKATISLLDRIKNVAIKVRAKERKLNGEVKETLKTAEGIAKLYYRLITSGKTLEEFYASEHLSEEEAYNLARYMDYINGLNKEAPHHGR